MKKKQEIMMQELEKQREKLKKEQEEYKKKIERAQALELEKMRKHVEE